MFINPLTDLKGVEEKEDVFNKAFVSNHKSLNSLFEICIILFPLIFSAYQINKAKSIYFFIIVEN